MSWAFKPMAGWHLFQAVRSTAGRIYFLPKDSNQLHGLE